MSIKPLRLAFMGTPACTLPVLKALIDGPHDIVCVYTQPPRPSGRGHKLQNTPVHDVALEHGLVVRTPQSLKKDDAARAEFLAENLDVVVVAGYGMMLPQDILDGPKFGCLNVHPSILPRWRGTSPVQHAIWHGDAQTGVAVMRLVQQMDAGPVYGIKKVDITNKTTAPSLDETLWRLGADLLSEVLDKLAGGEEVKFTEQDEDGVTYAKLLSREDGKVDWTQTAEAIDRQIRALTPWPGVWTLTGDGKRLKIIEAEATTDAFTEPPGTIVDHMGHVACGGDTGLRLIRVQPESAKAMDVPSAMNGNYLKADDVLGR